MRRKPPHVRGRKPAAKSALSSSDVVVRRGRQDLVGDAPVPKPRLGILEPHVAPNLVAAKYVPIAVRLWHPAARRRHGPRAGFASS